MLLRLAADVKHPRDFKEPVFDFRCEDDHGSGTSLHEFLDDLNAHERYFEMTTEVKTYFSLHDHEETFAIVEEDVTASSTRRSLQDHRATSEDNVLD